VTRLLETGVLDGYNGHYLEPAAGRGAIVKAVDAYRALRPRPPASWCLVEIDTRHVPALRTLKQELYVGDFTSSAPFDSAVYRGFDVAITNPPFDLAHAYIEKLFELQVPYIALLLRLNFLGTAGRATFLRRYPPDVFVLPDRASFVGGTTDSIEYAWFVWKPGVRRDCGEIRVLATTPLAERKPLK
jgi:hypothetical protein